MRHIVGRSRERVQRRKLEVCCVRSGRPSETASKECIGSGETLIRREGERARCESQNEDEPWVLRSPSLLWFTVDSTDPDGELDPALTLRRCLRTA